MAGHSPSLISPNWGVILITIHHEVFMEKVVKIVLVMVNDPIVFEPN